MPRPRTVSDEQILAAAAEAVGDVGPDRMTLADVGRRVGLSAPTLLQRFGSRRDLLLALAAHDVDNVPRRIRRAGEAPGSVLEALIAVLVAQAAEIDDATRFANHLAFLLKDLAEPGFREVAHRYGAGVTSALRDVLKIAGERGELDDRDPGLLAERVHVVYNGALITWGMTGRGTPAASVERHLAAVLPGIGSRAG